MALPFLATVLIPAVLSAGATAISAGVAGVAAAAFWSKVGISFLVGSLSGALA